MDQVKDKGALTSREQKVLRSLGDKAPHTIAEIARKAFPGKGTAGITQGNSMVRNSLRKPVKLRLVKQTGRGTYTITEKGVEALPA